MAIRDLMSTENMLDVVWIDTHSNPADIGTKVMKDIQGYKIMRDILLTDYDESSADPSKTKTG